MCHVLPALSLYGSICVLEAGDTYSRRLLCILYGSGKGKMTNDRVVSGLTCVTLAYRKPLWMYPAPLSVGRVCSGSVPLPGD